MWGGRVMFKKFKAVGKKVAAAKTILSDVQMIRREMKRVPHGKSWADSIRLWGAAARIVIQVSLLYCREILFLLATHHRLIRGACKGVLVLIDLVVKAANIARKEAK